MFGLNFGKSLSEKGGIFNERNRGDQQASLSPGVSGEAG
jgi:hypothetical protein